MNAKEIVELIISNTASQYSGEWKPDKVYTKDELIQMVTESLSKTIHAKSVSDGEIGASKAIRLIHEWLASDDCWIEDKDGNKIEGAVISGDGLYDHLAKGLGLSQTTESNSSNNSSSWISVEDRLPKDDQECDLWHKSKGRCINYHFLDYQTTKGRLAYFRSNDGGIIQHNLNQITHWHPLPPPPVKKEKEEKGGNDLFIKGSSVAT